MDIEFLPNLPTKGVVLLSGGLDSAVLLAHCIAGGHDVVGLCVYYGQRHEKEILAAQNVANYYEVDLITLSLQPVFGRNPESSLLDMHKAIPHGEYMNGEIPTTYVPFRNGLFLAIAAAIAYNIGASFVAFGAHSNDGAAAYPDCTSSFAYAMSSVIAAGTYGAVHVFAPFIYKEKADVVARGIDLEVPFHLTWSCYEGEETPCGKCATCLDRAAAFTTHGITE